MKVNALISVATIEPLTAHHGSVRPPRKKSRIVTFLPLNAWPIQVVSSRYPITTPQSNNLKCVSIAAISMPGKLATRACDPSAKFPQNQASPDAARMASSSSQR